jgi:excisionase family DNA binding protein
MNATETKPLQDESLWTAEDVASYLRISLSMVYKLRRTKRLPSVAIGALYRFDPNQVRAFGRGDLGARVVPLR